MGAYIMFGKNPLIPMGAITGRPSREELYGIFRKYSEVGIRQFLVYPRDGCEIEYMSDEWLDTCRNIAEISAELDFDIWLYDEFNFPSGRCNGQVMALNSDYEGKCLFINQKDSEIDIFIHSKKTAVDLLNPDAVDAFIQLTHQKYYDRLSKYFGSTIKGIFTDEPSYWYSYQDIGADFVIPYYDGIEDDYRAKSGGCLFDDIKANYNNDSIGGVWEIYDRLLGDRMRTVFIGKIRDWCDRHNIFFTGHLMDELDARLAVKLNGDILSSLSSFSLPGMDEIFTKVTIGEAEWLTLSTAKYAIDKVKNGGLAELFALGPSDMPLAKIRQMIWLTALFGVDRYVLAVSALDARGNLIRNRYFNPHNYMQPWFEAYGELGEDAKIAAAYARKTAAPDVQIRYPLTPAMREIHDGHGNINKTLLDVLKCLVRIQCQWELIGEEELPSSCPVLSVGDGFIDEEKSKRRFSKIDELSLFIESSIENKISVTDLSGNRAEDVLLRKYTDGSFAVLDLNDERGQRELYVNGKSFKLFARGIFVSDKGYGRQLDIKKAENVTNPVFDLAIDGGNYIRLQFLSNSFEFSAAEDIMGVRLLVRNYKNDAELLIDNKRYLCDNNCTCLPPGIRQFYSVTDAFDLKKGVHSVQLSNKVKDDKYLPLGFLFGDFSFGDGNILRRLPERTALGTLEGTLKNYAGRISLSTDVFIPDSGHKIFAEADTFGLYTKLFIDNEYIGERAWEPFVWEIPDKFKGRVARLTFEEYTSVAPLFGDTEVFDKEQPCMFDKKYVYAGRHTQSGIARLRLLYE